MQLIKKPPTLYPALDLGFCINLVWLSATNSGILVQSQTLNVTSVSTSTSTATTDYHQHIKLPSNIICHYDLAIEDLVGKGGGISDIPPKFGWEIFSNLKDRVKAFGNIAVAYDGCKNIYTKTKLNRPDDHQSVSILNYDILFNSKI
ncbi:hypothetical protein CROQUDRAFT_101517 [Cronartium quercuum f. sp. fusiforme G11]|uniref:Uncharacterized protein n=1 Tax=Cronartium quercuum f. sp. fusiforme G11 TaxID=708437 RepID=A0A9P6N5B8_9BASI|nr:hypothetical protein CROQUDRAFT_101517 [Cronartium quercuum f. sp. fusiforme G11]